MRLYFRSFLAFLMLPLLLSCGSDDGPSDPAGSPLDGIELSADSATTLDRIRLSGIPDTAKDTFEDYRVLVTADGTEPLSLYVERDEGGPFFRVPLYAAAPNEGGTARVQVTRGSLAGPELNLRIEPLPASPGTFGTLVDRLRELVQQRAQWAGTSFEELAALEFDEVPDSQLSLKVAQSYLDGAGPHDLASLVENEAGFLNPDERELLDRMFGYAPLELVIQADMEEFAAGSAASPAAWTARTAKAGCIDVGPEIGTAQELVDAMVLASLGDAAIDPNGAGRYLDAVGELFTGLGVVPGVGKIFTVAGVGLAVWQSAAAGVRGTYPSELTALQFVLDKNGFNEDDVTPAKWSDVELTAKSAGWVADESLVNVVLSTVGAYVSLRHSTSIDEMDALRDMGMARYNSRMQDFLDAHGGIIEFCPQTWTVDISDPDFSTAGVLEHRFTVDRDAQSVLPAEVGADVLRIATVPGLFAGQDIHRDEPLETKAITVVVDPSVIRVEEPGETVDLTARIENAEVTSLYWNPGPGTWEDGTGDDTSDGRTRPFKTPSDPGLYPFRVEVESTSGQGLRADGEPRRFDFALIRLDEPELRIAPRDTCIQPGDQVQFRVAVEGVEDYEVIWSKVEGYGSISQGGLYSSLGQGTSNAVIAAHIASNPAIADTTTIDVRGCTCYFQADLGIASLGGSDVAYTTLFVEGSGIYNFFFQLGTGSDTGLGLSILGTEETPAPEPGDIGTWPVSFVYFEGDASWNAAPDDEAGNVDLHLEELTTEFMEGYLTGTAVRRNQEGDVISTIPVSVSFRAGNWIEGWPCE